MRFLRSSSIGMNDTSIFRLRSASVSMPGVWRNHELHRDAKLLGEFARQIGGDARAACRSRPLTTNSADGTGANTTPARSLPVGMSSFIAATRSGVASSSVGVPVSCMARTSSSLQMLHHRLHPRGAFDREAPQRRTADQHGARTERQRLEDVCAAPDAAIDIDLGVAAHRGGDLGDHLGGRDGGIEMAAAVVRHHDALHADVDAAHARRRRAARPSRPPAWRSASPAIPDRGTWSGTSRCPCAPDRRRCAPPAGRPC